MVFATVLIVSEVHRGNTMSPRQPSESFGGRRNFVSRQILWNSIMEE